jgi:rare lipoprotein A
MKQAIFVLLSFTLAAVAQEPQNAPDEQGLASWYGELFQGRQAANGETFDMEQLTAAHRTLPFGTAVRVRRLDTGATVIVRINDRGPVPEARIIDLSKAAAEKIGMVDPGVVPVALEVVQRPALSIASRLVYAVQVGAYHVRRNAERALNVALAWAPSRMVYRSGETDLWNILVGESGTRAEAEALASRIRANKGLENAFVVQVEYADSAAGE